MMPSDCSSQSEEPREPLVRRANVRDFPTDVEWDRRDIRLDRQHDWRVVDVPGIQLGRIYTSNMMSDHDLRIDAQ